MARIPPLRTPRRPPRVAYVRTRRRRREQVPRHWPVWTRAALLDAGWRARGLTSAVRAATLVRARVGTYLDPAAPDDCVLACAVGGRLTCVSELARWGVFVLDDSHLHVRVPPTASRLRAVERSLRVHWAADDASGWASVDVIEALREATRCQTPRAAIATLDSALHLGLIGEDELDDVFAGLPQRLQVLRLHLDPSAESGSESLMRLLLRRLGAGVECQVGIPGVGRVDFLVDGWLIVECDSRAHHSEWAAQVRDRRRDQAAAARGFATFRPVAEDIFWNPDSVIAAVTGLRRMRAAA